MRSSRPQTQSRGRNVCLWRPFVALIHISSVFDKKRSEIHLAKSRRLQLISLIFEYFKKGAKIKKGIFRMPSTQKKIYDKRKELLIKQRG